AVLAAVRHHPPALLLPVGPVGFGLLDELDVPPGRRAQRAGVVIAVASQREAVGGQLIPLLARHLARLAADAQARIGEKALGLPGGRRRLDVHQAPVLLHHARRPERTLQVKALSSWM